MNPSVIYNTFRFAVAIGYAVLLYIYFRFLRRHME